MPEAPKTTLSESEIQGFKAAGRLFDHMVSEALVGNSPEVVTTWHDDLDEETGEPHSNPNVTVGGQSARSYARQLIEYTTTDRVLVQTAAQTFNNMLSRDWDNTLAFYEELDVLADEVDALTMPPSEYYVLARSELREAEVALGTANTDIVAYHLACTAVAKWADAVEAAEDATSQN